MSDNLVPEHLRAIRSDVAEIKTDMVEVREPLGMIEGAYASLSRRVDRLAGDMERVKRRLDIAEVGA